MDPADQARSIVTAYLDGFASGDPERVAACVTDDFFNEHTSSLGSSLRGRQAYLERLPGFMSAFRQLRYELVELVVDGDRAVARYRMTAISSGHPIDIPGVMWFEIRDGLIARRTDFWDSLTFVRQTE